MTPTMHADPHIQSALVRAKNYGCLAKALKEPSAGQLPWDCPELQELLDQYSPRATSPHVEEYATMDLQHLRRQFHRLFESHGPMLAPPYETEYLRDWPQQTLLHPAVLADLSGFYRAFGLQISPDLAERPDHVRLQLEFLHFLALKEVISIELQEPEHLEVVHAAQMRFLEDHTSRWTQGFAERVCTHDTTGFYKRVAQAIRKWTRSELEAFGCKQHCSACPGQQDQSRRCTGGII